ncbi:MAG: hypothetical protein SGI73_21855 [Chloroflexota bacterium]|nr:hypothetical protein [Chloroflexota bacterium]
MELHDDDRPIGRVLSRREILALLGGAGAVALVGAAGVKLVGAQTTVTPMPTLTGTATAVPSCVVRPALNEGPYFVDEMLNRSDIRVEPSDDSIKAGVVLKLNYTVSDVTGGVCSPLEGVQVDVWHCDALGVYSGVQDRRFDTRALTFLRGYQLTDANGAAAFTTIVPDWYSGRAVHIHFKIRTDPAAAAGYEFTSQLFFDPDQVTAIYADEAYAGKGATPDTPNDADGIFQGSDGLLTLELVEDEDGSYSANFSIGLDLSAEPVEAGGMGGGRPSRPPGA